MLCKVQTLARVSTKLLGASQLYSLVKTIPFANAAASIYIYMYMRVYVHRCETSCGGFRADIEAPIYCICGCHLHMHVLHVLLFSTNLEPAIHCLTGHRIIK